MLPDSRGNHDFPKWSNDGGLIQNVCINLNKGIRCCVYSHDCLSSFVSFFFNLGSPSTSCGEKQDGSTAGLHQTCKNTEIETYVFVSHHVASHDFLLMIFLIRFQLMIFK